MPESHRCTKCQQDRPVSEFYVQNKETGRLNPWCKPCYKDWYRGRAKRPLPSTRDCLQCKTAFAPRRSNMVFCSANCKAVASYKRLNPPDPDRKCMMCGKPIDITRRSDMKFCSAACTVHERRGDGRESLARRKHNLKRAYGMTEADVTALLLAQDGRCAICGTDDPSRSRHGVFHVDHCHATGLTRGLLCSPCNVALGNMQDDPARLRTAADYIERHRTP